MLMAFVAIAIGCPCVGVVAEVPVCGGFGVGLALKFRSLAPDSRTLVLMHDDH